MKFAKVFQQVLTEEEIPEDWKDRAIQYKKLKKRINKVVEELENIGISKDEVKFNYNLEMIKSEIHPHLQIKISPFQKNLIVDKLNELNYQYEINPLKIEEIDNDSISIKSAINPFDDSKPFYELKISLLEDTKFFQILYDEIEDLNKFKTEKEAEISNKVELIANEVSHVTIPKMKRTDLYVWREIFQYYIENEIFFSTIERKAGIVDINQSKKRFIKFLKNIEDSKIIEKFHQKDSIIAFNKFKKLNFQILKISNYQNFNMIAVTKILKKFDKQTQLTSSKTIFPKLILINNEINILNGSIAKDICFIISTKLLTIVPQIDDYLCPICCSIAYKPIRLKCGHLFCIRCLVKLRRRNEDKCPLCRNECLLSLTSEDLDIAQMNYMKMYFPKEVREKEIENSREILEEQHVIDPNAKACVIM
ncbi:hypothetical protein C6P40_002979 [Pichia californica]|uniref:RING-14 protein n=1 Tax=Pichia californica TaxID=460514 RepID=A0A9P6WH18_9ASCO|nr:hypothetical protein C6P42_005189 [[Candida] californica]KAG0687030.1 hypothetical protein C6P40_002979 [[Candida] californica]